MINESFFSSQLSSNRLKVDGIVNKYINEFLLTEITVT